LENVHAKKDRMVLGLRLPQGLLRRFEVLVLAEKVGFKLSIKSIPQQLSTDLGYCKDTRQ
jgi:hypothetical protein